VAVEEDARYSSTSSSSISFDICPTRHSCDRLSHAGTPVLSSIGWGRSSTGRPFSASRRRPQELSTTSCTEVTVRIRDHTAFVQARGVFTRADGTQGQNRYTDVYMRCNGDWKAVAAQVTPIVSTP
jgi:hypothetical protein